MKTYTVYRINIINDQWFALVDVKGRDKALFLVSALKLACPDQNFTYEKGN